MNKIKNVKPKIQNTDIDPQRRRMGHFHIERKRNKKNHKTIQGLDNIYSI
jgi:hypothetical protein